MRRSSTSTERAPAGRRGSAVRIRLGLRSTPSSMRRASALRLSPGQSRTIRASAYPVSYWRRATPRGHLDRAGSRWEAWVGGPHPTRLTVDAVFNAAGLGAQALARAIEDYPRERVPRLVLAKGHTARAPRPSGLPLGGVGRRSASDSAYGRRRLQCGGPRRSGSRPGNRGLSARARTPSRTGEGPHRAGTSTERAPAGRRGSAVRIRLGLRSTPSSMRRASALRLSPGQSRTIRASAYPVSYWRRATPRGHLDRAGSRWEAWVGGPHPTRLTVDAVFNAAGLGAQAL